MRVFWAGVLFILLVGVVVVAPGASPVTAQSPTLTPSRTLAPLQTTATSKYQGLRPTPTPLTLTTDPTLAGIISEFDMRGVSGTFADQTINLYRALNTYGIADFVMFVAMGMITVVFAVRTLNKLNKTHD
ncbi:MAG TPA: hypothetical protein PLD47_13905 [Aggregatilineales bacterium]|nr:MAG: hypothetical protein HKUEN02_01080 [Anaerolineaceae bacterium]HRE48816.1 hypothetical protein [Aggregatilineales bacterium]